MSVKSKPETQKPPVGKNDTPRRLADPASGKLKTILNALNGHLKKSNTPEKDVAEVEKNFAYV